MKKTFIAKIAALFAVILLLLAGCGANSSAAPQAEPVTSAPASGGSAEEPGRQMSVLVYITGMLAGSPTYQLMADGANDFAAENPGLTVKVYEAGFNQAEWEEQLTSLVASGEYDLVIGSNPSLPEICASVAAKFPSQKFVITDAELAGNPQIRTYLFNQYEQSLYLGYLAGLITTSTELSHANPAKLIGFIAAQEYPLLSKHIVPGFLDGARRADPEISLDYRVIGNWSDANKAGELARSMIAAGVDVFGSIAGGASVGMTRAEEELGAYEVFYNNDAYATAPGVILGCGIVRQKELTEEILAHALAGTIEYGTATTVGVKDGYLDFQSDNPDYLQYVPEDIRTKMSAFLSGLKDGSVTYTLPPL
jgi:simple sugar transport system substrate-binding protein